VAGQTPELSSEELVEGLGRVWLDGLDKIEMRKKGLIEEEGLDMFFAWLNIGMLRIEYHANEDVYCFRYPCLPPVARPNRVYRPGHRARIEELEKQASEHAQKLMANLDHLAADGMHYYSTIEKRQY
jgi:hypothetical protein